MNMRSLAAGSLLLALAACSGTTFDREQDGETVEVQRRRRFTVALPASNRSLSPEDRFTRHRPDIRGKGVEFLRHEYDPPSDQGGTTGEDRYEFMAVEQGEVTLQFWRIYDRGEGESVKKKGYSISIFKLF